MPDGRTARAGRGSPLTEVLVTWYDDNHLAGVTDLVQAVAGTGGAVGWLTVPEPDEVRTWLVDLIGGGSQLAVATQDGAVLACGALTRERPVVLAGMAAVRKVMTHPTRRGRGAGRAVVQHLIEEARRQGLELLTLECRGNNHAAQRLYASLGFEVTGRRPDAIAVAAERFDQVLMHRDLRRGTAGLDRHGSRGEGPGAT